MVVEVERAHGTGLEAIGDNELESPIEQLYPGVDVLRAQNPHTTASNCYLINKEAIVDPGPDIEKIKRALAKLNVPLSSIKYILLTHYHEDHAASAGAWQQLAKELGINIIVLGSAIGMAEMTSGSYEYSGSKIYHKEPTPLMIDGALHGGEVIRLSNGEIIRVHKTPGHSPSDLSFEYITKNEKGEVIKVWFVGDAIIGSFDERILSILKTWRRTLLYFNSIGLRVGIDVFCPGHVLLEVLFKDFFVRFTQEDDPDALPEGFEQMRNPWLE